MADAPYHLSIAASLEDYRAEIEHAFSFLEACHRIVRDSSAAIRVHYGDDPPPGSAVIPARIFPGCVEVDGAGIHPRRELLAAEIGRCLAAMAPNGGPDDATTVDGDRRALAYDAVGLIFVLISRLEERGYADCDRHQRYPLAASIVEAQDGRLYPWADRAAQDIARCIFGEAPPFRTQFSIKLTHDVDRLKGYHRPLEPLRNAAGDLLKRRQPARAFKRIRNGYLRREPETSFRRLMALSEARGLASHFYFMGPSDNPMDSPYVRRNSDRLHRMTGEVARRGHRIGFHPGYRSATDKDEWARQRAGLEAVIGQPVSQGRQHVLRWRADTTPAIWSNAGMQDDYTLAFPEAVGFRTGSCRPHAAYDLVRRRTLPLRQTATAVTDFGLLDTRYLALAPDAALDQAMWALALCREFNGTFVVLFHTGIAERNYWRFYEALLAACR